MKLTNKTNTDRLEFMRSYQIKDMETLKYILAGDPVSFVNVRHPYERLVSAFTMHHKHQWKGIHLKTFEQFIVEDVLMDSLKSRNKTTMRNMDPHTRPLNTICAFCNIQYSVVSKEETFVEDKARIMQILGLEDETKEQRLNIGLGSNSENYTQELFKEIFNFSQELFKEIFNY